jgi:thiol-disulfide isomerase/thioredoxin
VPDVASAQEAEEEEAEEQEPTTTTSADKEKTRLIQEAIQQKRPVFLMLYMKTCGPCQRAHPEWLGLQHRREHLPKDLLFADIESQYLTPDLQLGVEPRGFPSMYYMRNGAKVSEFDEDMAEEASEADETTSGTRRTLHNLLKWIQKVHPHPKTHPKTHPKRKSKGNKTKTRGGGRRRRRRTRRRQHKN